MRVTNSKSYLPPSVLRLSKPILPPSQNFSRNKNCITTHKNRLRRHSMAEQSSHELYLKVEADGTLKVGTCEHCVVKEPKRPDRAWNPNGDGELDFDRDM